MTKKSKTDLVVLGGGPGGYSASYMANNLGINSIIIDDRSALGGVCANVGCIPTKALLHIASLYEEAQTLENFGIEFKSKQINQEKLLNWKDSIVNKLTSGLEFMAKKRGVEIIRGSGKFLDKNHINIERDSGAQTLEFDKAIIAVGSTPVIPGFLPKDPRILTSDDAVNLKGLGKKILIIGGGVIGMETATMYSSLGTDVTIIELSQMILAGIDADMAMHLYNKMKTKCKILLQTKVEKITSSDACLTAVYSDSTGKQFSEDFDYVLVAVGRKPNTHNIGLDNLGVELAKDGSIKVDNQRRTNLPNIYAIGDVIGGKYTLAHKASSEGRLVAEVISGKKYYFEPMCIPAVAYTSPEVAWTGYTENDLKESSIQYEKSYFPWSANGRSLTNANTIGSTKLIFEKNTQKLIGGSIVGPNAGELINMVNLAIEMGCVAEDLSLNICAHPTLSETIQMSAEVFLGTATDIYVPKTKK